MSESAAQSEGNVVALPAPGDRLRALEQENLQLRHALETRIVIEQAKGAASARLGVQPEVAFEIMRGLARSQRRNLHEFAAEVIERRGRLS